MPHHALTIIGGGFSGTALATYLLNRGGNGLDINIVEPRPSLGWGVAYGDAAPFHILNVPAQRMSLWQNNADGFLDWARRHGPRLGWAKAGSADGNTYLPRRLFGHYVAAELDLALSQSKTVDGPRLVHHRTMVVDIQRKGDGYRVCLADGRDLPSDTIVLATGFQAPLWPFPVTGRPDRLVANPWADSALAGIGRDDDILVVGTGLTMIDMIYSLSRGGHRGKVTALSRHGHLPLVHGVWNPLAPLIQVEDAEKGIVSALRRFRTRLRWGRADWRSAIDSLRPITDSLWQALPAADQDRFLRHLSPFWEVHRHRMPSESADLLLKRVSQGRLAVTAAKIAEITGGSEDVQVRYRPRHGNVEVTRHFHWVINCTPPASPFDSRLDGLPQTLQRQQLARPHRTGLGFDAKLDGTLRDGHGHPIHGIFVLGPIRRGHAVEATAVPHIRPQLETLCGAILERSRRPQP
mgnify:FL=1